MRSCHPSLPASYAGRARVGLLVMCILCQVELMDELNLETEIVLCRCNSRKCHTICAARWRYALGDGDARCPSCRCVIPDSVQSELDALVSSLLGTGVLGDTATAGRRSRIEDDAASDAGFIDDDAWLDAALGHGTVQVAAVSSTTPAAPTASATPPTVVDLDAQAPVHVIRGESTLYLVLFYPY